MTDIRIERLVHVYPEGTRALDGVDLAIPGGQRVAIVGANGSGKSTLVRHLDGLLRPTEGHVLLDGHAIDGRRVASLAATVGMVFQDPDRQIFAGRVRTEVAFGARNVGLRGGALDQAVAQALAAVGLDADAGSNPYDLGPARRKLLSIASVLAMGTPVVVLDEPTLGQDAHGIARLGRLVAGLGSEGRTVIGISHNLRFVADAFERVVVLAAGRVVLDGPPSRVLVAVDSGGASGA
jgi:energy-coupling factor transport system ATP-binding protein